MEQARRELGARQLADLLHVELRGDRLPSGEQWIREVSGLGGSREVLEYLRNERPLPIREFACAVLRSGPFLMAPSLVERSSEVQVAMRSQLYAGRPPMETWLQRRVVSGVVDALQTAAEQDRAGAALLEEEAEDYVLLREVFGVELGLCRRVMLRFNALDSLVRSVVFDVVARGRSVHDIAEEHKGDVREVVEVFDRTLTSILSRDTSVPDYDSPWMTFADDLLDGEEL